MSKKKEKEQTDLMDPSKDLKESLKTAQEFIVWAKAQKIKQFKYQGLEFEVSELAYVEHLTDVTQQPSQTTPAENSPPILGTATTETVDEEELYWSTR